MARSSIPEKSSDPKLYADQVAAMVMSRWDHTRSVYRSYFDKVPGWYDTYRGFYTGRFQQFRNNVNIPLVFAAIQNDVARKVQMTFGNIPVVQMFGYGPEDADIARRNETLISAQLNDCRSFEKAVDFYLSADLYGTAVLQYGWKEDIQKQKVRVPRPTPTGSMLEVIGEQQVEKFNGPDWIVRDILDCGPATNSKYIDEMDYFTVRMWLDLDQIEQLTKLKFFDSSQVEYLKNIGPMRESYDELKERMGTVRSLFDEATARAEKYSKPVQIHEMWGIFPDELVPADGCKMRVVTVADGRVVLRNEPNPFWHGDKPFLAYSPMSDPHYFFGPGKIEVAQKMQWTANRLVNQKLDALDLIIDPVFLYDKNRFTNRQELYVRAGRPIGVDGPPGEIITPLTPDLRGVQLSYTEIDTLWSYIEQGTGVIRDTVQGLGAGKRQTAREFIGRQEGALTRLAMEAKLAEETWIQPLAQKFRALNRQFLPVPRQLRILGQGATVNQITGEPTQPEQQIVNLSDLQPDYDVRALGASQMIGRAAMQQNLTLLLQAASMNPAAMTLINWRAFFRQLFITFDIKNVDELLNSNEVMQQQAQQIQQSAAAQNPQQNTQANGSPNEMNPDMLAQLIGGQVGVQ